MAGLRRRVTGVRLLLLCCATLAHCVIVSTIHTVFTYNLQVSCVVGMVSNIIKIKLSRAIRYIFIITTSTHRFYFSFQYEYRREARVTRDGVLARNKPTNSTGTVPGCARNVPLSARRRGTCTAVVGARPRPSLRLD